MAMAEVEACNSCGSKDGPDHACAPGGALIGQVLDGRYEVESVLGQGGMGMVFRAVQTSVHRPVAVKTLHPSLASSPAFFERFRREAELASRLRHPNVITIYDFGRASDGTCFYVMELLEGESLKQLVKREGLMTLGRALKIIEQAAKGLAHAHAQGCIHRDLKPHNLMLTQMDGEDLVKVLDFGLVKALESEEEEQLTSTGMILGTPQYMPPEQAGGDVVDVRSDLYSLTGVLYFCLTGTSPYGANTAQKALRAAMTQQVAPVGTHRHGAPVPRTVDEFIRKGLAREKEDRYQTAEEFLAELREVLRGLNRTDLTAEPLGGVVAPTKEPSSAAHSGQDGRTITGRAKGAGSGQTAITGELPRTGERPKLVPSVPVGGQRPTTPDLPSLRPSGQVASVPAPVAASTPAPIRRRGKRSAKGILIASIAGAVLLVSGAAIVRATRNNPAPPAAPPPEVAAPVVPVAAAVVEAAPTPPPVADVVVTVRSNPPGAAIFEGSAQIGTAPAELKLSRAGVHVVSFQLPGFEPQTRTLDLSRLATDATDLEVTLVEQAKKPVPVVKPKKPEIPIYE